MGQPEPESIKVNPHQTRNRPVPQVGSGGLYLKPDPKTDEKET